MVTKFLDEFTPWIIDMITNHSNIILKGDFNTHVSNEDVAEVTTFLDTIEALGLEQWVDETTHRGDNILDLVVFRLRLRLNLFLSARIIVIYNIECTVQCINKCCKCMDNSY